MTEEEKDSINRRLLEFAGFIFFIFDYCPEDGEESGCDGCTATGIAEGSDCNAIVEQKPMPDLFSETKGSEWREKVMLKLARDCILIAPQYQKSRAKWVCRMRHEDHEIESSYHHADTYAEAFCMAADAAIQALEGKESE